MKQENIKIDDNGAQVRVDKSGVYLIGKSINLNSVHSAENDISIGNSNVLFDGKGNITIGTAQTNTSA
ncbi:hypothetical protein J7I01_004848 [Vibrio parahaemolyticus]|nr:hypothetical protein [Vibrio parahaemolyticus]